MLDLGLKEFDVVFGLDLHEMAVLLGNRREQFFAVAVPACHSLFIS